MQNSTLADQLERTIRKKFIFVAVVTLVLQSCAIIRTHLDGSCVSQFAKQYPDPQESRFVLPWNIGESYKLTQGNCTLESHNLLANQPMSFDFRMPIGTPVLAADDGRVFVVVEKFKDGVDKGFSEANVIGIEHAGGILSWYAHLTFEGSVVRVDEQVSRGDLIGYSGNTGDTAYPHLHFFAQQLIDDCHDAEKRTANLELCPQVPISFSNVSPNDVVLKEWVTYTALPY